MGRWGDRSEFDGFLKKGEIRIGEWGRNYPLHVKDVIHERYQDVGLATSNEFDGIYGQERTRECLWS